MLQLEEEIVSVAQAAAQGIPWGRLQWRDWKRVGPGQYVQRWTPAGPEVRVVAAGLRLPNGAAFAGPTAGWLHTLSIAPADPIEVIAPIGCRISARARMRVRRAQLKPSEIVDIDGQPVTNMVRTICDLAWMLRLEDAVAAADEALHRQLVGRDELHAGAERRAGRQGVGKLRRLVTLVEPLAESPMETRLRLLLVMGGLPRPVAQAEIRNSYGTVIARADLFYPESRLVLEYDGSTHRDSLVEDSRRQNLLIEAGYQVLRFTSADVLKTPAAVVDQVRRSLRAR